MGDNDAATAPTAETADLSSSSTSEGHHHRHHHHHDDGAAAEILPSPPTSTPSASGDSTSAAASDLPSPPTSTPTVTASASATSAATTEAILSLPSLPSVPSASPSASASAIHIDFGELVAGIDLLWNGKFAEAEAVFAKHKAVSPRHALHYAETVFVRSFITADNRDTEAGFQRLKECKALTDTHLKFYEKNTLPPGVLFPAANKSAFINAYFDCRVVLGEVLYMNAVLNALKGSRVKGALQLRKSWKVFEATMENFKNVDQYHPDLMISLRFGCGIFLFAMSVIPSTYLKLAEFVGFKADRVEGLKSMRETFERGSVRKSFAAIVLLFNNLLLPRGLADVTEFVASADQLVKVCLAKYPEGPFFHVFGSHCARKMGDIEKGIYHMNQALENCRSIPKPPQMFLSELASCHMMNMQWETAATGFEALVSCPEFQVRHLSSLQLVGCYMMLNRLDKATQLLHQTNAYPHKSGTDNYVDHVATKYLIAGPQLCLWEILYIKRDLAKMQRPLAAHPTLLDETAAKVPGALGLPTPAAAPKKTGFSLNTFKNIVDKPDKTANSYIVDNRALYLLIKGAILKYVTNIGCEESIALFKEILTLPRDKMVDKWYVPYAYYELCESYFYNGQRDQAIEMAKKASSIDGYTWEDMLRVRLGVTSSQLKKGASPGEVLLTKANDPALRTPGGTPGASSTTTSAAATTTPTPAPPSPSTSSSHTTSSTSTSSSGGH